MKKVIWQRYFRWIDPLPMGLLLVFLVLNTLLRFGLWYWATEEGLTTWQVFKFFSIGFLFDFCVGLILMVPAALVAWFWPRRWWPQSWYRYWSALWWFGLILFMVFVAVCEIIFWNEFSTRFNFIAVDYLIYTREILGNIEESYPITKIISGLVLTAVVLAGVSWYILEPVQVGADSFRHRSRLGLTWLVAALLGLLVLDARWKEMDNDARVIQLAGNGIFEFLYAFRNNEIDYTQFYRTIPMAHAADMLRGEFQSPAARTFLPRSLMAIERHIQAPGLEKKLNVVLITVESLSASFLGSFGNTQHLTPVLDHLAQESLFFTQLYATGTRTVRGLEALSLSLPPTPGHSVIKRPNNDNLFTLGEVFAAKGYEPLFIYGGYSYFDNMEGFFSGNGYTVIDRTALKKEEISYESIWGVADEDLFNLTLRTLDDRYARHKPFFAHLMTTSNHRPFGFPAGRIDLSQGTREGAVKYTDWAIGQFIEKARKRPWFDNTVFVVVADHCAEGRGKMELTIENFHIPLFVYAPKYFHPQRIDTLASQIDIPPTLLALLNFSYTSRFFGQDILSEGEKHQRALMANYQTVGYLDEGRLVELQPKGRAKVVNYQTGQPYPFDELSIHLIDEAISYYQIASEAYDKGYLKYIKTKHTQHSK